jgi:DNA polymerase (family X)
VALGMRPMIAGVALPRNAEVIEQIELLADMLELEGTEAFRVLAYRRAAQRIGETGGSIAQLALDGKAKQLQGIGKTIEEKIVQIVEKGEIEALTKRRERIPPDVVAFMRLPGLGPKTARRIWLELDVTTLAGLQEAAEQQRLRTLTGLGPKVEENVLAALGKLKDRGPSERLLLSEVLPVAEELATHLRAHPASDAVEVAGSARRRTETCHDIDLIATASEPAALAQALLDHPLAAAKGSAGESGARITTHNGVAVDLRIVAPDAYGNLLQHFTGSAEHNIELRERAVSMGLSVSEHGITEIESGEVARYATEAEVYERLGMAYIEPELREANGEIAAAADGSLPKLVRADDIRGDLHCHTTLSDGHNTLEEMAEAARSRGYAYLAVTDHSASHGFGNDVPPDRLWERIEEVRGLNSGRRGFRVLAGSEVNILPDGSLDYDDELLGELDWVIASVHTSFKISGRAMTERVVAAIEHPLVDCIGHLSGRLIGRRDPYDIDVQAVAEAAAGTGTMLEINGNPNRRDLSERHARLASEAGVMICVNTDAHRTQTLGNIVYGIATARRAWLTAEQVANTRPWREFSRLRKRARRPG